MNWGRLIGRGAQAGFRILAERDIAHLRAENARLQDEAAYWKARAEALIDADRVRTGAAPVMRPPTTDAHLTPFRGLSMSTVPSKTSIPVKEPTS